MNACRQWHDRLLDYTAGELCLPEARAVEEHLKDCAACAAAAGQLRALANEIDGALRQLVEEPQPRLGFPARVLARVQARSARAAWRGWQVGVAAAAVTSVILVAMVLLPRPPNRRPAIGPPPPAPVTALSAWRSPTDGLLRSPGDELLQSEPRLGRFYFRFGPGRKASHKRNGGNRNES